MLELFMWYLVDGCTEIQEDGRYFEGISACLYTLLHSHLKYLIGIRPATLVLELLLLVKRCIYSTSGVSRVYIYICSVHHPQNGHLYI